MKRSSKEYLRFKSWYQRRNDHTKEKQLKNLVIVTLTILVKKNIIQQKLNLSFKPLTSPF